MNLLIKRITAIIFITIFISISQLYAQPKNIISTMENNSILISYEIPDELKPGEEHIVNVTLLNNSKSVWKKSGNYQLAMFDQAENKFFQTDVWGITNVPLPYNVNPDEKVIFLFKITAPEKSGIYNCRCIMKKDSVYFGDYSDVSIKVGKESPSNLLNNDEITSQFISLTAPDNMVAGEKYKIIVIMKNTGKYAWYAAAGSDYKLSPVNDSSSVLYPEWNSSSVYLSNTVDTGQISTIEFYVTAPDVSGKYSLQWMMKKGDYFFGQKTNKVFVSVSKNSKKVNDSRLNNSSFIEQDIPNSMVLNEDHLVSVTMKNTGNKTWIKGNEQLVLVDPGMMLTTLNAWGVGYIQLPNNVDPGKTVTFKFKVRPGKTGWQYFQMIMMDDEDNIFGETTRSVEIIVSGK